MKSNLLKLMVIAISFCACKKEKQSPVPEKQLNTADAERQINLLVNELDIKGINVAVFDENQIIWEKCSGYSNKEQNIKSSASTVFGVASLAKNVIGLSVLKLVEEGKLDLDRNVNDYLPFKVSNPYQPQNQITLRKLMTHTSGITDSVYKERLFQDFLTIGYDHPYSLEDFMKAVLVKGGKHYEDYTFQKGPVPSYYYSNIGASLAAYIVEQVSHQPFDQFSTNQFFRPLELNSMKWHLRDLAGYEYSGNYDEHRNNVGKASLVDYASGGLNSNIRDLANLGRLFLNNGTSNGHKILSPASIAEMQKVPYPENLPEQALFMEKKSFKGTPFYGNNGTMEGFNSYMYWSPKFKRGIVILLNSKIQGCDGRDVNRLIGYLMNI